MDGVPLSAQEINHQPGKFVKSLFIDAVTTAFEHVQLAIRNKPGGGISVADRDDRISGTPDQQRRHQ
jgi:hypothetical protein